MKKRILTFISAFLFVAALASGCSAPGEEGVVRIGVIQMVHHPSLDEIREAFLAEMLNLGYTEDNFDVRVGPGNDMAALTSIAQIFIGDNVDLIMAITTPGALAAAGAVAAAGSDIPIVFSAVSNPVNAGLVDRLDQTDRNITGISDALDVEAIFALVRQLTPDARRFGLVYSFEPNAVSIINEVKEYFAANPQHGFSYIEATVTSTADVQDAALSLVGDIDAFFTATDNTVAAAMPLFAQVAIDAGLPIFTGADSMVRDGGFATVGIDYILLGAETARLVDKVLDGTPVSQLPVVVMYNVQPPVPIVNANTAAAIGIGLDGFLGNVFEGN